MKIKLPASESKVIATLIPESGLLRLTKTMLDKSIIDANASIRQFALLFDIDFDKMTAGEKHSIDARFDTGESCRLNFYRTVMRGDRRFSCSGINKFASAGDLVALSIENGAVVVNVTRAASESVAV